MIDESAVAEPILKALLANDEMTREKAMQIPALAGAINEIAETVANVPIKLYKRGKKRVEEVKGDWRIHLLNEDTGDTLDANMMKQALVKDYLLDGEGNVYVDWEENEIQSLRYVQSNHVSYAPNADVIFVQKAKEKRLRGWSFGFTNPTEERAEGNGMPVRTITDLLSLHPAQGNSVRLA